MAEQKWWEAAPIVSDATTDGDWWQSAPLADAEPDLQKALDETMAIAKGGGTIEDADAMLQQKYGVTYDDVSRFYDNQQGIEVYGVPVPRALVAPFVGQAQGVASNWADEGRGVVMGAVEALTGGSYDEGYNRSVEQSRRMEQSLRDTNPGGYLAGQMAGGVNQAVIAPGLSGAKYTAAAPSVLNLAGRSALVGAGQGAVAGAGAADGDMIDRAQGLLMGGGTGALLGGALPLAGKAVGAAGNYAVGKVRDWFNAPEVIPGILAAADGSTMPGGAGRIPDDILVKPSEIDAARRRIAQQLSRDMIPDSVTPAQITGQLDRIGGPAALGDLGPNLQAEVQTAASRPGPGRVIAENNLNARQLGPVDPATGLRPEIGGQAQRVLDSARLGLGASGEDAMAAFNLKRAERAANAQTAYGAAETGFQPVDLNDLVKSLDRQIAGAKGSIQATLQRARALFDDASGASYEGMHQTKLALDDLIDSIGKDNSAGNVSRARLVDLKRRFLDAVTADDANPLYGEAIRKYAGDSAALDALSLGQRAVSMAGKSLDEIRSELSTMGPSEREFFREGLMLGVRDMTLSTSRTAGVARKIEDIPSKLLLMREAFDSQAEFDRFRQALQGEIRMFDTFNKTTRGSQTQPRLANEMDQAGFLDSAADAAMAARDVANGNPIGILGAARKWWDSQKFTEGANAEIARILTDPQASRDPAVLRGILDLARRDNQMRGILGLVAPAASRAAAPWTTGILGLGGN